MCLPCCIAIPAKVTHASCITKIHRSVVHGSVKLGNIGES